MAYTVWGAFDAFRKLQVDLDAEQTKKARKSRDYLFDQIREIANGDLSFPRLYGSYVPFGSFARRTKIRPLDDIDVLVLLKGRGTIDTASPNDPYTCWLKITEPNSPLAIFPDASGYVNSTKILNKIKACLSLVPNYGKAELHRNMQAVTLSLKSYDWVFDIVPAVPVDDGNGGISYYVIPNGRGDWIRTDPRIDDANVTKTNTAHNGEFLPTVRLLKYWNMRTHKRRLPSYYFETLALKVFGSASPIVDFAGAVTTFLDQFPVYLWASCPDPKRLGPDLDAEIPFETKKSVADAAKEASTFAHYAALYAGDPQNAIYWWGRVFGSEFPVYG